MTALMVGMVPPVSAVIGVHRALQAPRGSVVSVAPPGLLAL